MDDDEDWLSEQKYNIIYVEDDEQVRINFQEIFQDFF